MSAETAHEFYERLGCVILSGYMSVFWHDNTQTFKKKMGLPNEWQKKQKYDYDKNLNGFAMRTGLDVGMTAIDIDDPTLPHCKKLMEMMSHCNMIQKTKKGFHYVFSYSSHIGNKANNELCIDTRNDGGCLYVEPSIAKTTKGEIIAQYQWIKKPAEGEELQEITPEIIDYLRELWPNYVIEEEMSEEEMDDTKEPEASSVETTTTEPRNEGDRNLMAVVEALPVKHIDNYDDWVKIGMIFHNEGYSCDD